MSFIIFAVKTKFSLVWDLFQSKSFIAPYRGITDNVVFDIVMHSFDHGRCIEILIALSSDWFAWHVFFLKHATEGKTFFNM